LELKDADNKSRSVSVTLDTLPGSLPGAEFAIPDKLPKDLSRLKALQQIEKKDAKGEAGKDAKDKEARKSETGFFKRNTGDGEHQYWVYVPKNYDANKSHGMVVCLHQPERNKEGDFEDFAARWEDYCIERGLILVLPKSDNTEGWIASESDYVVRCVQDIAKQYTIDRQRVVTHGQGIAGQMALYLAIHQRELFRGVATVGAVPNSLKDNQPQQRLAFWLGAGELDPLVKSIAEARVQCAQKRFSAVFREMPNRGREYLPDLIVAEVVRWIDTLDKQ
jgi:poly(3-hydroxybutyrate) depolymerase